MPWMSCFFTCVYSNIREYPQKLNYVSKTSAKSGNPKSVGRQSKDSFLYLYQKLISSKKQLQIFIRKTNFLKKRIDF